MDYIPGFLAFREVPHLQQLIDELKESRPGEKEGSKGVCLRCLLIGADRMVFLLHFCIFGVADLVPDVILVDGNGVFHPRGCGLASHLGVLEDIPTIGVGKTLMHVDGIDKDTLPGMLAEREPGNDHVLLKGISGIVHAAAFYPTKQIKNPVIVSVGHGLSLETALEICRSCSQYRVPEPVRQADIRSREEIRAWEASCCLTTTSESAATESEEHEDLEER